jgi:hypothetical protein
MKNNHVNVSGTLRQNVRLACQVFSGSITAGIKAYSSHESRDKIAEFFQTVNDAFDVMNSTSCVDKCPLKRAFTGSDEQTEVLQTLKRQLLNLRVKGKKIMLPFQEGWIISIRRI